MLRSTSRTACRGKYNGHPFIYFGAAKKHCALHACVPSGSAERLKDFSVSKGTVRSTPEYPLPAALVKDLVKMKTTEIEPRWPIKPRRNAAKKTAKNGTREI